MVQGAPLGDKVAAGAGVSEEAGMGRCREPCQRGRRVDAKVQRAPAGRNGRHGDEEVTPRSRPDEDVAGEQADGGASWHGPARPDDDTGKARAHGIDPEQRIHRTVEERGQGPANGVVDRALRA